jgi:hypothetical protein
VLDPPVHYELRGLLPVELGEQVWHADGSESVGADLRLQVQLRWLELQIINAACVFSLETPVVRLPHLRTTLVANALLPLNLRPHRHVVTLDHLLLDD